MFNPSREQARRFLMDAWAKRRGGRPATPLETLAADLVEVHPEYHSLLEFGEDGLARDWTSEDGEANPFLHLSLHLAIEEQLSIDQPPGICALFDELCRKRGDRHTAAHDVLECLGETIWQANRDKAPLDAAAYLDCLRRRSGMA